MSNRGEIGDYNINYKETISSNIRQEILNKIRYLLENKYLYQSIHLELNKIKEIILKARDKPFPRYHQAQISGSIPTQKELDEKLRNNLQDYFIRILDSDWKFATEEVSFPPESKQIEASIHENEIRIILPTIKIPCKNCKNEINPHNSGFKGLYNNFKELSFSSIKSRCQLFFFPYQCQGCKG